MTNRRRPWHQCFVRRVTRHTTVRPIMTPPPLSLMAAVKLFGSLISLLSGIFAAALVLVATSIGSLTCQLRKHQDLPT